jgi:two-component system nitrate/nitrite response regulator NarL
MDYSPEAFSRACDISIDIVVVSQVCLFRECISHCLADSDGIQVLDTCDRLDQALRSVERLSPDMVLLDARFSGGAAIGAELGKVGGETQIVAMALEESEENILAWAEAGIAGYIADTASMRDFPQLLRQIRLGRQACASHVVGDLLRRIGRMGRESEARVTPAEAALTPRERAIQRYIGAGLSNKDIARELDISVGTTKSHVHNILAKLNLSSRAQVAARMGRAHELIT